MERILRIRLHFTVALLLTFAPTVYGQTSLQQLPPTPIGTLTECPAGYQNLLSYSGASSGQAAINCVPIATDASGDLSAGGYIQAGSSVAPCDAPHAGAIRFNSAIQTFEGCSSGTWTTLGANAPTGTICGLQTNNVNFGPRCQGYAPYNLACPPGYSPNYWSVSFGNGRFMFCSKD